MTSGSLDANRGEPTGVRIIARRWLTAIVSLAALVCAAASAAAESTSLPDEITLWSAQAPATSDGPMPGMIGPIGSPEVELVEYPRLQVGQYAPVAPPAGMVPPWPSSGETSVLAPQSAAPEPEIGYLMADRDPLLGPGCRRVGPVRRWVHGLFGLRALPVGWQQPLRREDWCFRPFTIGWFMGGITGSPLMDDWVSQKSGYFAGYRIGWDYTSYWGCEMRLGFGYLGLADSQRAIEAQQLADSRVHLPPSDPFFSRFDQRRDSDLVLWDVSLLYYPWGNTNWRPYFLAGLGAARVDFLDRLSDRRAETALEIPLGAGVKHRVRDWLALRFDVTDNIVFGQKFNTVHDLSFTAGVELLLGGTRKAYWPWNPSRHYWFW